MINELIFSLETPKQIKKEIFNRRIRSILSFIGSILIRFFSFIGSKIGALFAYFYTGFYPKREKIKNKSKKLIILYGIIVLTVNIVLEISEKPAKWSLLAIVPLLVLIYIALRNLLYIYHCLIGEYQLLEEDYRYTVEYVTTKQDRIIKTHGPTGGGKDTWQSGCGSILSRDLRNKTYNDIEEIKQICYIFDFTELEASLKSNFEEFLTFSKGNIEKAFIGDFTNNPPIEGLGAVNGFFIKKYYLKNRIITAEGLLSDYYAFMKNPLMHETEYAEGLGVNRRHFLQIIMEDYIQWYIRIYVEENFIMSNQPMIEDPDSGLMAKMFSFNFLRTKHQELKYKENKETKKGQEKVYFPWKDRIILLETECGTWYSNKDGDIASDLLRGGIRDFKAYQRHFMRDFYWFQADQSPTRTNVLFRELDHSYAGVLSREKILGGKKINMLLNMYLKYIDYRLNRIINKAYKQSIKRNKKQQLLDDTKRLYAASNSKKIEKKLQKLEYKIKPKPFKNNYYKYLAKQSLIKTRIKENENNGYIVQLVCISKFPNMPSDVKPVELKEIIKMKLKPVSFVTRYVFKTSDCERYDTRYLRNLSEELAIKTDLFYEGVERWNPDFRMTKEDIKYMGYQAANDMYGISSDEAIKTRIFGFEKKGGR